MAMVMIMTINIIIIMKVTIAMINDDCDDRGGL